MRRDTVLARSSEDARARFAQLVEAGAAAIVVSGRESPAPGTTVSTSPNGSLPDPVRGTIEICGHAHYSAMPSEWPRPSVVRRKRLRNFPPMSTQSTQPAFFSIAEPQSAILQFARTLLILALAEAGLGRADEAAAAGQAALNSTGPVWPTPILAERLDRVLMRGGGDATEAAKYHTPYSDVTQRASSGFNNGDPAPARGATK
jgi:hypothetical protein